MAETLRAESAHSAEADRAQAVAFRWFLGGVASWFAAWGMQSVLFSWLIVGELRASADRVGTAQMAVLLPNLFLLLVGGATADRGDRRRLLIGLHVLAAALVTALGFTIAAHRFSFPVLIAYALAMGTTQSFMMPARDALLSEVAGADVMRAVTTSTIVQFGLQSVGALIGGGARWIGTTAALWFQATILLAGVVPFARLRRTLTRPVPGRRPTALHIREGLIEVWQVPRLRFPVLLASSNALLFLGPYVVCIPLMIRDFYQGDVAQLAIVNMMFPLGTIAGSVTLLLRGGIRRKGLAMLLALVGGGLCLLTFAFGLPFWGLLVAVFAWGICGSVMFNASRTLVQLAAPPTHRARVLSAYSLGMFGAGPLGALQAGFIAQHLGPFAACAISAITMLALVVLVALCTPMARME